MNLKAELKKSKSLLIEQMNAIAALETEENELTDEQKAEFDTKRKHVERINARLERQEQIETLEAKSARVAKDKDEDEDEDKSADEDEDDKDKDDEDEDDKKSKKSIFAPKKKSVFDMHYATGPVIKHARPRNEKKGTRAARFIISKGIGEAMGSLRAAETFARYDLGDVEVSKALNSLQQVTGGALIPQDFVNELIGLLYSDTVIRGNGAPVYPMPWGNMTWPTMTAGANAYWVGELDPIPPTQQAFSDKQLRARKLVAMTPVTMDLIRRSPLALESLILYDLKQQIALKEDLAYLLAPGTDAAVPPGLASLASAANVYNAAALPASNANGAILLAVQQLFLNMALQLRAQNVSTSNAKWIMNHSVVAYLSSLTDGVGRPFFFQNGDLNLYGYPIVPTNLLPTNISVASGAATSGGGTRAATTTDNTQIFLVNFDDLIVADVMGLMTDTSNEASYIDGSGVTRSTFQWDQVLFRTIKEVDFNVRRPQSIVAATVTGMAPAGYVGNAGLVYSGPPADTTASFAGSASPVAASPTVFANPAAVVTGNTSAAGAPGGTITPNASGSAYEGS